MSLVGSILENVGKAGMTLFARLENSGMKLQGKPTQEPILGVLCIFGLNRLPRHDVYLMGPNGERKTPDADGRVLLPMSWKGCNAVILRKDTNALVEALAVPFVINGVLEYFIGEATGGNFRLAAI